MVFGGSTPRLLTASFAHGQSPEGKFGSSPDGFAFDLGLGFARLA